MAKGNRLWVNAFDPEEWVVDSNHQSDKDWLLSVQKKLYRWSKENPQDRYRDMWNWLLDPRNLRCAWHTVATNKGRRSAGVDGKTVRSIQKSKGGEAAFLLLLRQKLRAGAYRPSQVKRKLIPKPGKPGKFRPLGIATVKDRVVQAALKQLLEPIFEADFWPVSYGFRPKRSCRDAIEHIRITIRPRAHKGEKRPSHPPYQWVIEGDIKGCFDNIDHHLLMDKIRLRIKDIKVLRLVRAFLKAGVLAEDAFVRTPAGTPQGGILSPLLANIMLSSIEQRYQRWVRPAVNLWGKPIVCPERAARANRNNDRRKGRLVLYPVRYADDFVILVAGTEEDARIEKQALARYLKQTMNLELSEDKTLVSPVAKGFKFLGHRVRLRWDQRFGYWPRIEVPKDKIKDLKYRVKQRTKRDRLYLSLDALIKELNPILRGWGYFYRHCHNGSRIFSAMDNYLWWRLYGWLRKKYRKLPARTLMTRFYRRPSTGRQGRWMQQTSLFLLTEISVYRHSLKWMRYPDFAYTTGEPGAYRKAHARFGESSPTDRLG
jgi:RNA-directed DNA polymerase